MTTSNGERTDVERAAERMDVVHVTRATLGGVRRHVIDLMLGLHRLGVRQALVYSPDEADAAFWEGLERLTAAGVASFAVPMAREIRARDDFRAGREILRIVRRLRPRVLHLHASKAGGIGRLAALAMPGVRVVYSPHASAANISRVYTGIERLLGRLRADRIVAVSESERRELERLGFVSPSKLVTVDAGVEAAEVRGAAGEAPAVPLPEGRIVICAGRMSPQKDPEFMVKVARELAPRFPDVHFVWIGDGELRPRVEAQVAEAGLGSRWTTTGWLANPFPLIAGAEVFALPSRYESFGYVTLEAMILGKPVVSTDITGSSDLVVPGETGFLVPPGDAAAFAEAVAGILSDPARAEALGEAARRRAEHFSRDRMAREALGVYQSLGVPAPAGAE